MPRKANKGSFKKGHESWLKGTKGLVEPWNKGKKTGRIPWNKGKKMDKPAWNKGLTKEDAPQMGNSGRKPGSSDSRKGTSWTNSGSFKPGHEPYYVTDPEVAAERARKCSEAKKGKPVPWMTGENHWNWHGGVTPEYKTIRGSPEYDDWRTAVFERDGYTCQFCEQTGGYLHAHHIKGFARFPESRFDLENGITLCEDCHFTLHWGDSYAG